MNLEKKGLKRGQPILTISQFHVSPLGERYDPSVVLPKKMPCAKFGRNWQSGSKYKNVTEWQTA